MTTVVFTLLYVDDEPANLAVFEKGFGKEFNVLTAQNAQEAFLILEQVKAHVILADERMPGLTGTEFFGMVKKRYPYSIRILTTAYSDVDHIADAIRNGDVYYFIRKPWVAQELRYLIQTALSFYTLQKRNQDLSKHLSRSMSDLDLFFYRSYHDLQGPVTSQLALIDMFEKGLISQDEVTKVVTLIGEAATKLNNAIKKIQYLPQSTTPVTEGTVVVRDIVYEILSGFQYELQSHNIKFELVDDGRATLLANEKVLRNLIEALIENSISFCDTEKDHKSISLSVEKTNEVLCLQVNDNGIGIESDKLDYIFEPFYRVAHSKAGNGLGLYLAKKLVEQLNGRIVVKSRAGLGTEMSLFIPC